MARFASKRILHQKNTKLPFVRHYQKIKFILFCCLLPYQITEKRSFMSMVRREIFSTQGYVPVQKSSPMRYYVAGVKTIQKRGNMAAVFMTHCLLTYG